MDDSRSIEELQRLLKEVRQRAEASKRELQAERQQAQAERQQAQAERQQVQQRAEASERELQAERQQAQAERQQLQQRAEAAERSVETAQRDVETAQRERDVLKEETRHTTLNEYIKACHDLVFSKFAVEADKSLTTKGSITNPRNKLCPTNLQQWPDFIEQQRDILGTLFDTFDANQPYFHSQHYLTTLGEEISQRPIANEKNLEHFLHLTVENPVRRIMDRLKEEGKVRDKVNIGNGIVFENHPHAISENSEEVLDRETPSTPPQTPHYRQDLRYLRPDQICIYRSEDSQHAKRTMIYVCEYKAPHKLTALHLRAGLRSMDICKEVVNRSTIPTEEGARFQYHAERLTAAAISQTYHYMIEGGLHYGLLTTGETIVFLKVDWSDPATLYYHFAEPIHEVSSHPDQYSSCTAVGQLLTFSLMALGEPGQDQVVRQEERQRAIQGLNKWTEDFDAILRSIPLTDRKPTIESPAYLPTDYAGIDRSPRLVRRYRPRRAKGDEPPGQPSGRGSPDPSDDESSPRQPETPSPAERRRAGEQGPRRSQRILAHRSRGGGEQDQGRPYCTQKCLRGLITGGFLDKSCPNVELHTGRNRPLRHPVNHAQWLQLLYEQLEQSLDDGITRLDQEGARGVLFQVTLLAYGYTFVSKGTVRAFISDLEHEAMVYERLQPVQGSAVPVFLGAIDLRSMDKIYYYDHRVYIVHLTFLAWGGYCVRTLDIGDEEKKQLRDQAVRSLRSIHREGVVHMDVREANMLFNPETNRVMVIDFERAVLLEPTRRSVAPMVPNKRAWVQPSLNSSYDQLNKRFAVDISMAVAML